MGESSRCARPRGVQRAAVRPLIPGGGRNSGEELGREDPHYFNRFPTEVQNAAQNVRIPAEPILENSG
jgi:hypothetical protein